MDPGFAVRTGGDDPDVSLAASAGGTRCRIGQGGARREVPVLKQDMIEPVDGGALDFEHEVLPLVLVLCPDVHSARKPYAIVDGEDLSVIDEVEARRIERAQAIRQKDFDGGAMGPESGLDFCRTLLTSETVEKNFDLNSGARPFFKGRTHARACFVVLENVEKEMDTLLGAPDGLVHFFESACSRGEESGSIACGGEGVLSARPSGEQGVVKGFLSGGRRGPVLLDELFSCADVAAESSFESRTPKRPPCHGPEAWERDQGQEPSQGGLRATPPPQQYAGDTEQRQELQRREGSQESPEGPALKLSKVAAKKIHPTSVGEARVESERAQRKRPLVPTPEAFLCGC